jgi:hypothetical protein
MTTPVTPPATPTVPTYPPLGSPTFNQDAYAVGSAMPSIVAGIAALADNAAQNTQISHDNSALALQAKDLALAAAEAAAAYSDFKGLWTTLAAKPNPADRVLNMPASVLHNNRIWLLLSNLADVALAEPGISPAWSTGGGGIVTQRVSVSTSMSANVAYTGTAPGILMTAPTTLLSGDVLEFMNATAERSYANFNGLTVKGQSPDSPMTIPPFRGFRLRYDGVTLK